MRLICSAIFIIEHSLKRRNRNNNFKCRRRFLRERWPSQIVRETFLLNFSYKKLTQPFLLISGGVAYFSENWKPKFILNSVSKPLLFSCKMCSFLRQNFFGGFLRTWLTTCDNSSSRATKELSISNPFHLHNYFCQHFISFGQWLWLS